MREWFSGKSVCIVGGAQSLFDKELGKEIDSYDVVCRLNGGIEIVKPESQGSRTDVWGIGKWWTVSHLFDKCEWGKAIHLAAKGQYLRYHPETKELFHRDMEEYIESDEIHPAYDCVLPTEFFQDMGKFYESKTTSKLRYSQINMYVKVPRQILKASTGLIMSYYTSISNPKSVTLYGFDWKRTPTWYFGEEEYNETHQPHDWEWEEWFIKELLDVTVIE